VLGWFDAHHIDFVSSIPAADGTPFTDSSRLFEPQSSASKGIRVVVQMEMLMTGGRNGALFVMIGRKRE
jgi:hypothetical protein